MPTSKSNGDFRMAAELAFRRKMFRGFIAFGVLLLLLVAINAVFWLRLGHGIVIATSENPKTGEQIVVRDLPAYNPFWTASLGSLFEYHVYRCEYYHYGTTFTSAQSYTDRGYKLTSAWIAWRSDNSASVAFGSEPDLICQQGWWSKAR